VTGKNNFGKIDLILTCVVSQYTYHTGPFFGNCILFKKFHLVYICCPLYPNHDLPIILIFKNVQGPDSLI